MSGYLKAGEYGYETMLQARKLSKALSNALPQLRLEAQELTELKTLFASPKALHDAIKAIYQVSLNPTQSKRLHHYIETSQFEAQKATRFHQRKFMDLLSSIDPDFRQPPKRKHFVFQLQEFHKIQRHHHILAPLKTQLSSPTELQELIQKQLGYHLPEEQATPLFHFIHNGTHDGTKSSSRLELSKYKRWLGKIQPQYGQDFQAFVSALSEALSPSTQAQIMSDLAPLKDSFENARQLFEAIQAKWGIALQRVKAEALFALIQTGTLDGQTAPSDEELFKIKLIFTGFKPPLFRTSPTIR